MKLPAMTEEQLRTVFPKLAALADAGNDGAMEVLHILEMNETRLEVSQIETIEFLVSQYGVLLFPDKFGKQDVARVRIQFTMKPTATTVVYEMSDNNYAACGITFVGALPTFIHVNDNSYAFSGEGSLDVLLTDIHLRFGKFWDHDGDTPNIPEFNMAKNPMKHRIVPPIVDCRLGLQEPEHTVELCVMQLIRRFVTTYSPYAADVLFTSEQPGYDIVSEFFTLRTYDRHSSDYTHTWNFVWRDFAVQWYGRISRDPTFNRSLTSDEVVELLSDVIAGLRKHAFPPEPAKVKPLTTEQALRIDRKLQSNGHSGAFSKANPNLQSLTTNVRRDEN